MTAADPELAVVVLSYAEPPRVVLEAVDSILAQDEPVELIVSHSGPADTARVLERARPQVAVAYRPQQRLVGAARNAGVGATRAPYVAFLAADCRARAGWAAGRLRRHRGGAEVVAACVVPARATLPALVACLLTDGYRLPGCRAPEEFRFGASYARELLDRFGGFPEELDFGEDAALHRRLLDDGIGIELAEDVVVEHRYPLTPAGMLRDQFVRGRGRGRLTAPRARRFMVRAALYQAPQGVLRARRSGVLTRRQWPVALVLLLAGAGARTIGVMVGGVGGPAARTELEFGRWAAERARDPGRRALEGELSPTRLLGRRRSG